MQDNISPEARLLRLIRGEHRKPAPKQEQTSKVKATQSKKETLKLQREHFSFNRLNKILLLTILALGIYLLANFIILSPSRIEKRVIALGKTEAATLDIPLPLSSFVKPVAYYSEAVKSRNIFTAQATQTKQLRPSATFREMISKLRLQGIISGPNPQAVIEDTETKQIHFLSPGNFIGEIELKQILPGKITLYYYGQEAELAL